jgi:hypothetical protein
MANSDNVEQFPRPQIRPEQFEAYEAVILTGQMPEDAVPKFMQNNPAFETWYRRKRSR